MKNSRRIGKDAMGRMLVATAILATTQLPVSVQAAEPEHTTLELWQRGLGAHERAEWLDAVRYLSAFVLRRPVVLVEDGAFEAQVEVALQTSITQLDAKIVRLEERIEVLEHAINSQAGSQTSSTSLSSTVFGLVASADPLPGELVPGQTAPHLALPPGADLTPLDEVLSQRPIQPATIAQTPKPVAPASVDTVSQPGCSLVQGGPNGGQHVIHFYGLTERCHVGPVEYYLVNGAAPAGPMAGEDCVPVKAVGMNARQIGNDVLIEENLLVRFQGFASVEEAQRLVTVAQDLGITHTCYVGPWSSPLMHYFRR